MNGRHWDGIWPALAICFAFIATLALVQIAEDRFSARAEVEKMVAQGRDAAFRKECLPARPNDIAHLSRTDSGRLLCVITTGNGWGEAAMVTRVAQQDATR